MVPMQFIVRGCFAMNELGYGANVRIVETIITYDPCTKRILVHCT